MTRSAPNRAASARAARTLAALPATPPTVGFSWASAIRMVLGAIQPVYCADPPAATHRDAERVQTSAARKTGARIGFRDRSSIQRTCGTRERFHRCQATAKRRSTMGRGLLLWLIGIPIPIILLLYLFGFMH